MIARSPNFKNGQTEVIPAVLAKTESELIASIEKVRPFVKRVHIDVMDNKFVPNLTVGLEGFSKLPNGVEYEFHWMVEKPQDWIRKLDGKHLHLVHVETIGSNWGEIRKIVKEKGGALGIVINPETPVESLAPYAKDCVQALVMGVHPGFSGQAYITEVEKKISYLKKAFPKLDIEIDGGVDADTAVSAAKAGANKLAAASAIFKAKDVEQAIKKLGESGERGSSHDEG